MKNTPTYTHDQLVVIFEAIFGAAIEQIEHGLPSGGFPVCERHSYTGGRPTELTKFDCGVMAATGTSIAMFYAVVTGDAIGGADGVLVPVDGRSFQTVIQNWVCEAVVDGRLWTPNPKPYAVYWANHFSNK